jgi:hypothetical protein
MACVCQIFNGISVSSFLSLSTPHNLYIVALHLPLNFFLLRAKLGHASRDSSPTSVPWYGRGRGISADSNGMGELWSGFVPLCVEAYDPLQ